MKKYSSCFGHLLSTCPKHEEDFANFCVLLSKSELYHLPLLSLLSWKNRNSKLKASHFSVIILKNLHLKILYKGSDCWQNSFQDSIHSLFGVELKKYTLLNMTLNNESLSTNPDFFFTKMSVLILKELICNCLFDKINRYIDIFLYIDIFRRKNKFKQPYWLSDFSFLFKVSKISTKYSGRKNNFVFEEQKSLSSVSVLLNRSRISN